MYLKKNEIYLIKIFIKMNLIKYVRKLKNNEFIIFINFDRTSSPIYFKNFYKPSMLLFLKKKEILKIINLKKEILIVSNNCGVNLFLPHQITSGGLLLAKAYLNN
jgi:hypothetical protein